MMKQYEKCKLHNFIDIVSGIISNIPGESLLKQTEKESVECFLDLVICLSQMPQSSHIEGIRDCNHPNRNQSMYVMREGPVYQAAGAWSACVKVSPSSLT